MEEWREVKGVAKPFSVEREEIPEDLEECGRGAPEITEVNVNAGGSLGSFGFT